jgi:flavorubredoxin
MSFAPIAPTHRVAPEQFAPDTWLIHSVAQALGEEPVFVYLNSMVITGAEPVIVDTGTICNRTQWLDDVFGIVDPADVRWVFVSHDDVDHIGNLEQVMEACPEATLVASWAITERHANALNFPLPQCRWLNDGEGFDAGDRRLRAVRPPVYDSPTTRGLFDERTGVYWAADCFAAPMPAAPCARMSDLDLDVVAEAVPTLYYHGLSPWLTIVDATRFAATCDAVRALEMSTIASAHGPVVTEESIEKSFQIIRGLPSATPDPCPDQAVLDAILATAGS